MVEKTTSQNTGSDSKKAIKHSSNSAKSSTKATKTKKPQSAKRQKAAQEIRILAPIIATFFVSGLVAMVGVVVNYVQHDFQLSDTISSFLASAIYIWFVLIAIPTAYIMNNLGHKKTVLLALILSCVSMAIPILYYSPITMVISLCTLGIANTIMQISLNLLVSDVTPKRQMSSMLTLGQFVGQIPAMIIPLLAMLASLWFGSWRWVYPFFLAVSLGITYWLYRTKVEESADKDPSGIMDIIGLLRKPVILLCFIGIILQVGIDVGISITTPKIIMERTGASTESANFVLMVYAIVRLIGCLGGAFILSQFSNKKIYIASIALILLGCAGLLFINSRILIYICTIFMGLGVSNLFAILFSQALDTFPRKKNDISVLLIMGLVGGAIFPPIMGIGTKLVGGHQFGAIIVIMLCAIGMLYISKQLKDE